MPYLVALLLVAFALGLQYFLSHWLIKIGWFYGYAYFMGGFVLFIFLALATFMKIFPFLKIESDRLSSKKEIEQRNHKGNAAILCIILTFLGGFWLNVKFNDFQEKFEYDTYGIHTKAVIIEKYEVQNKNHSYVVVLKPQAPPQQKGLNHSVSKGVYTSWKIGDTISIFYSPRYSNMLKIHQSHKTEIKK